MSFYTEMAETARALLAEFGAQTTLTHKADGTYDPDTATATPAETTDTVQACVFPIADALIDGTMVQAGDKTAYLSAVNVTAPRPNDVLAWQGATLTVVKAKNIAPAGTAVLFECQVR